MTYWITTHSSGRKCYHRDEDCKMLDYADTTKEATESHLIFLDKCSECFGDEIERDNGAEWAKFTKKLRHHPEEFDA